MFKLFRCTYNDGGWHSGDLPHFYYVAKNKEEVVANSKKYQEFIEWRDSRGGDVWISEIVSVVGSHPPLIYSFEAENLGDFELTLTIKERTKDEGNSD